MNLPTQDNPILSHTYIKVPEENNSNGGKFKHIWQNGQNLRPSETIYICLHFANDVFLGIHQAYYNQLTFLFYLIN